MSKPLPRVSLVLVGAIALAFVYRDQLDAKIVADWVAQRHCNGGSSADDIPLPLGCGTQWRAL